MRAGKVYCCSAENFLSYRQSPVPWLFFSNEGVSISEHINSIRWIIEPTVATIIICIFLELNESQHVSGIIMPIIRRTRTRLVKTSCEDAWLCWLWCPDGVENWTPTEYNWSRIPFELICAQQETLILRKMDINYRHRGALRKMSLINQHWDFFFSQPLQVVALSKGLC
jgi:hypothetical protein